MNITNTQITWEAQMLEFFLAPACQHVYITLVLIYQQQATRGGGLGSRPIFKKFNEPYAPS